MGLHLNWELRLPASTSRDEAWTRLETLHRRAQGSGFEEMTPVFDYDGSEFFGALGDHFRLWARVIARTHDEDLELPLTGDVHTAQGFVIYPGKGCEGAVFGVLRRAAADGTHGEWFWHCCCKTQYASVVSDDHLIFCHTSLVALLDHAIESGWDVVVRDETHYWETRDTGRLIKEVHKMNRIVARLAGFLSDRLESAGRPEAPIFDHPDYERLEMEKPEPD